MVGIDVGALSPTPPRRRPPVNEPPAIKHVTSEPAVPHVAPVPVIEYVSPAPVIEYIAPAPAVTYVVPSQQLPPVYTATTVTTDDNLDMTGLVCPQFSSTAVEPFAPHVVDSLLPWEEFAAPVYKQSIRSSSLQVR